MDDERRRILSQVAEGTMSPDEAAERLAVIDEARAERIKEAPAAPPPGDEPAKTVRILASLRSIEVQGDDSVREAIAEGPHRAWREFDQLVIEAEPPWDEDDGFRFGQGRHATIRWGNRRFRYDREPVKVRMNPALALRAEVNAGSMTIRDVHGPIRADVDAGALRVRDFASPIEIAVNAGSFMGEGVLKDGKSRVECNAGKVDLVLGRESSVRVRAASALGSVKLPGDVRPRRGGFLEGNSETTIGGGAGELRLSVNVGAATVRIEDD